MSFFAEQTVLITGGSSGIGLALARRLDRARARLILLARDPEKLSRAAQSLKGQPELLAVDIADGQALKEALEEHIGSIDILVNNAGIASAGNFLELPETDFEEMMAINYLGAVKLTRLVLPGMLERRRGGVAFVSSLVGLMGIWGYTSYAASKFALRGFAECLRAEVVHRGITVTVCHPPDTDTPQHEFEKPLLPAQTVAQANAAGLLTPDFVAGCLLRSLEKGRFEAIPGLMARLAVVANRLSPGLVRGILDLQSKRLPSLSL